MLWLLSYQFVMFFTLLILLVHRPGVTRLSFTYFMADEAIDYIIQAVTMIAKHGWKLLPLVCQPVNSELHNL